MKESRRMGLINEHALTHREDYLTARYCIRLGPDVSYDDLFIPKNWAKCNKQMHPYDVIRVIGHNDEFDVELTVTLITPAGATMRLRHKLPGQSDTERTFVPAPPEVRLQFTAATRWRLLGVGNEEIKRGMSKPEADVELQQYLKDAGLYLLNPISAEEVIE
jgi:hypothetical protein